MFAKGELVRIKKEFWLYAPTVGLGINNAMRKCKDKYTKLKLILLTELKRITDYIQTTDLVGFGTKIGLNRQMLLKTYIQKN